MHKQSSFRIEHVFFPCGIMQKKETISNGQFVRGEKNSAFEKNNQNPLIMFAWTLDLTKWSL